MKPMLISMIKLIEEVMLRLMSGGKRMLKFNKTKIFHVTLRFKEIKMTTEGLKLDLMMMLIEKLRLEKTINKTTMSRSGKMKFRTRMPKFSKMMH